MRKSGVTLGFRVIVAMILVNVSIALASAAEVTTGESELATNQESAVQSVTKRKSSKKIKSPAIATVSSKALVYGAESNADSGTLGQFEGYLNLRSEGELSYSLRAGLGSFTAPHSFYYQLPEAYMTYGDKFAKVSLGRKIENLSFADQQFNLGLIQGFNTHDFIDYTANGLVTISGYYAISNSAGFYVGYSPIFIPNQGPQIKVEEGKVTSSNRWAISPPKQFKFNGENKEIHYAIRDYKISDIVFNSGLILNAHLGGNTQRPALLITYAQKPINELALSRDTFADITTIQGNVLLTPVVLRHEVTSAELNLDYGNLKSTWSYLVDSPENKVAPEFETIQTLSALNVMAVYLGFDLKETMGRPFEIYMAAADISGGEIKDLNSQGQAGSFSFSASRTQFKRPIRIGLKADAFYIYNRPLQADIRMTYDQVHKGSLLSTRLAVATNYNLSLNIGADIVGVEFDSENPNETNFLDQNQANDRVSAGVDYVF